MTPINKRLFREDFGNASVLKNSIIKRESENSQYSNKKSVRLVDEDGETKHDYSIDMTDESPTKRSTTINQI